MGLNRPTEKAPLKLNRPKSISENHWVRLEEVEEGFCFVCGRYIKASKLSVSIGKHPDTGVELKRHMVCDAISDAWKARFNGCMKLNGSLG
jgi:hypothetical protein